MAVVAFDIDYFKRINDEWGHEIGDRVLVRVGELLSRESRDIDVCARFGGEEFVALMPGCGAAERRGLRRACARGARDRRRVGAARRCGLSAGVHAALAPNEVETMVQGADSALYKAKRSGRDRTIVYERASFEPVGDHRASAGAYR